MLLQIKREQNGKLIKKFEKENNVKMIFNSESKMAMVADAIAKKFYSTIDDYLLEEITEDFVMEYIEEFFRTHVEQQL